MEWHEAVSLLTTSHLRGMLQARFQFESTFSPRTKTSGASLETGYRIQ